MQGIRLDSGDLAYLSKQARKMLDNADLPYVKIVASNDLDENIIFNLKAQGARIDSWGVGTQLITAADNPSLGGVYKLVAKEDNEGGYRPVIKISGNPEKITTPGVKNVFRIMNKETGKAEADYIALADETDMLEGKPLKLFDPLHPYLFKNVANYEAVPLLRTIFHQGELEYRLPTLKEIQTFHEEQLQQFWPEYLRKLNPEKYPVDMSAKVWELKKSLIEKHHN